MARPPKEPLRALTETERQQLQMLAQARSVPADQIARATLILAIAEGSSFSEATQRAHRRSRQAVARLVCRYNKEGMTAIYGHHGGGPGIQYGAAEQARILQEFARSPDREHDGTAIWSLTTLQRALRRAPDGLPQISTYVIFHTLHQAGYTCQQNRTWCRTGTVQRKRQEGLVEVTDPAADEKRGTSSRRTP
jgi:transposase